MRNRLRPVRKAVILIGHGSKMAGFQSAMLRVARELRKDKRFDLVLCAYLEITPPSIEEAIRLCAKRGIKEIRVLPYFALLGTHVKEDIPRLVREAKEQVWKKVKIKLCPYLGYHNKIVEVVKERLER